MPTNLYGEKDNFHPENCHVITAMMRRIREAKLRGDTEEVVWRTGTPMRGFLYVYRMAAVSVHALLLGLEIFKANTQQMLSHINVGSGVHCTICKLVDTMQRMVGFQGKWVLDSSKRDSTPRELINVEHIKNLRW